MEKEITCSHCFATMEHLLRDEIQLGKSGWLLGNLPNLISGALAVDVYVCPTCHKLEFFAASEEEEEALPQITCPSCGATYDFDYPKCPHCKRPTDVIKG